MYTLEPIAYVWFLHQKHRNLGQRSKKLMFVSYSEKKTEGYTLWCWDAKIKNCYYATSDERKADSCTKA